MRLRIDPNRLSADGTEQLGEILDARVGVIFLCDQSVTRATKQIGVGTFDSRSFFAGHGMPAQKPGAAVRGEMLLRQFADYRLVLHASVTSAPGFAASAMSGRKSRAAFAGNAM